MAACPSLNPGVMAGSTCITLHIFPATVAAAAPAAASFLKQNVRASICYLLCRLEPLDAVVLLLEGKLSQ